MGAVWKLMRLPMLDPRQPGFKAYVYKQSGIKEDNIDRETDGYVKNKVKNTTGLCYYTRPRKRNTMRYFGLPGVT
jgi:hypothetical protein